MHRSHIAAPMNGDLDRREQRERDVSKDIGGKEGANGQEVGMCCIVGRLRQRVLRASFPLATLVPTLVSNARVHATYAHHVRSAVIARIVSSTYRLNVAGRSRGAGDFLCLRHARLFNTRLSRASRARSFTEHGELGNPSSRQTNVRHQSSPKNAKLLFG